LENIRKGISSGSISVKDTDKTLTQLTETEESLDDFIKKISEYSDTFNSMKNDLATLKPEILTSLENDFSKNTDSQNDSKLKSKTILAEIDEINSKIPQLVSKIEDKLQIFSNTKYVISLSEN
jgi:chromosome segregation ATPase